MAVAIDIGKWNDIHPENKKDAGEKLALAVKNLHMMRTFFIQGSLVNLKLFKAMK